jgi:hypothetical protein
MGWICVSPFRPIAKTGQNLTLGSASVASTAVGANTFAVQLSATGNCHVALGTAPVALGTDMLVKATDDPLVVKIAPGEKIAVIQDGASTGTLNIVELTH